MSSKEATRTLENTPTWAVAVVTAGFVVVSLIHVYLFGKLEEYFKRTHRRPLYDALQKVREELMLMGFISLLLTVFQYEIASICVKESLANHWNPCDIPEKKATTSGRRLLELDSWPMNLWTKEPLFHGRFLLARGKTTCPTDKVALLSTDSLHDLHVFIFVLAIVHLIYTLVAMLLASLKVRGWKAWENQALRNPPHELAQTTTSLTSNLHRSFVNHHTKPWTQNLVLVWIVCFFRQFGQSVSRGDYLALRMGFVNSHNTGHKFDFHSYMIRSLEDEFQKVVGISAPLWAFVVLFLLFNINGTNLYFYLALGPPVMVMVVGTKLQHVIATLALEYAGVTQGGQFAGATKLRDDLFWFRKPQLILFLIHFIIFQNAFEMATLVWFFWQFGVDSCFLENKVFVYIRLALSIIVQIMVNYSTLPLYAIVTQMGSHYKKAIFQHHVKDKIYSWRNDAKRRVKMGTLAEEGSSHQGRGDWTDDEFSNHPRAADSSHGNGEREANRPPQYPQNVPLSAAEIARSSDVEMGSAQATQNPKRPQGDIDVPPRGPVPLPPNSPYSIPMIPKEELPKKCDRQVSTVVSDEDPETQPPGGGHASFEFRP